MPAPRSSMRRAMNPTAGRRSRRSGKTRLRFEHLEGRLLLSNIVWENRGTLANDNDGFNHFGATPDNNGDIPAELARSVIDEVLNTWERVVPNFNTPASSKCGTPANTMHIEFVISTENATNGAKASTTCVDADGIPRTGRVKLGRGIDVDGDGEGDGGGWYFDPTPEEHSEFFGTLYNAFVAAAPAGTAPRGNSDLYTFALHEVGHIMGLPGGDTMRNFVTNTEITTGGSRTYWVFNGPSIDHLLVSSLDGSKGNLGHTSMPSPETKTFTFNDLERDETGFESHGYVYTLGTKGGATEEERDVDDDEEDPVGFPIYQLENLESNGQEFISYGMQNANYVKSAQIINPNPSGRTMLTRVDGEPFDFHSLKLTEVGQVEPQDVTFHVVYAGGSTSTRTVATAGAGSPRNYTLDFSNVVSVEIVCENSGSTQVALDAIRVGGRQQPIFFGGKSYVGAEDLMNTSTSGGVRKLLPNTLRLMLQDAYGYTTVNPDQFGTFYALLNERTDTVTVRGGAGGSADVISISQSGSTVTFSVDIGNDVPGTGPLPGEGDLPAFVTTYDTSEFNSILVLAGDGNDIVRVESIDAEIDIRILGEEGNDTVELQSISSGADVTVLGGDGDNIIRMEQVDQGTTVFALAGNGDDRIHVNSVGAGTEVYVEGYGGDDQLQLGNGYFEQNIKGDVHFDGGSGFDSVVLSDVQATVSSSFLMDEGQLLAGSAATGTVVDLQYSSAGGLAFAAEKFFLNSSPFNNTVHVESTRNVDSMYFTFGSGNDRVELSSPDSAMGLDAITAEIVVDGGGGINTVSVREDAVSGGREYQFASSELTTRWIDFGGLDYQRIDTMALVSGIDDDVVDINGSSGSTKIEVNVNAGHDHVTLGSLPEDDVLGDVMLTLDDGDNRVSLFNRGNVSGKITIFGDGDDNLRIDDYANLYLRVDHQLIDTFTYDIEHFGLDLLNVNTHDGDDVVALVGLADRASLYLDTGDDNDTVFLGEGDLSDLGGTISLAGAAGVDSIIVDDRFATVGANYSIGEFSVGVAAPSPASNSFSLEDFEDLTLYTGQGNDQVRLEKMFENVGDAERTVLLETGSGDDILHLASEKAETVNADVTFNGGEGADLLIYHDDQDAAGDDQYTITNATISKLSADNGFQRSVKYTEVEDFVIHGGMTDNHFQVDSLLAGSTLEINSGHGNDTHSLGTQVLGVFGNIAAHGEEGDDFFGFADFDSRIFRDVTVDGGPGQDSLVYHDRLDDGADDYTITDSQIGKSSILSRVIHGGLETIQLNANSDDNTIEIESLAAGATLTVDAWNGTDTVVVGSGMLENTILGEVVVKGGLGTDTLEVDDSLDSGNDRYTLADSSIVKQNVGRISYETTEIVSVKANGGDNDIDLRSLAGGVAVSLHAAAGDDRFFLGSDDRLDLILGNVALHGGGGVDEFHVNDHDSIIPPPSQITLITGYSFSADTITRPGIGDLSYHDVEQVTVNGGQAQSSLIHSIGGAPLNTQVAFEAGPSDDIFWVSLGNGANFAGGLAVEGNQGVDRLILFGADGGDTYFIDESSVSTATSATITYGAIEEVDLRAGGGADEIHIASTAAGVPVKILGGAGADTVRLESPPSSPITLQGQDPDHSPGDSLVITGTRVAVADYVPHATDTGSGFVAVNRMPVDFTGLETLTLRQFERVSLTTPNSNDDVSIMEPQRGWHQLSGASDDVAFAPLIVADVDHLLLGLGGNDDSRSVNRLLVAGGDMPAVGLDLLQVVTGQGRNMIEVTGGVTNLDFSDCNSPAADVSVNGSGATVHFIGPQNFASLQVAEESQVTFEGASHSVNVESVVINGFNLGDPLDLPSGPQPTSWMRQKSDIRTIRVNFNRPMKEFVPEDLRLTNLGVDAPHDPSRVVLLTADQLSTAGRSLSISFDSQELDQGVYRLEVFASACDSEGNALAETFRIEGDEVNGLYKLTGDWNGDGGVSIFDFPTLSYWFGAPVPLAPEYVDLNGDGGVSIFDFPEFAANFGVRAVFPSALVERSRTLPQHEPFDRKRALHDQQRAPRTHDDALMALLTESPRREWLLLPF